MSFDDEGGTEQVSKDVTRAMVDRAASFMYGGDAHCEDGTSCTHTDCYYRCMLEEVLSMSPTNRRVEELEAALRGWVEARDAYNAIDTSSIDHMIEEVKVAVPRLKEAEARARAVLKGVSQ